MIYVVQPGDSVDYIAELNDISVQELIYDNQILYPYRLSAGQALYIREPEAGDRRVVYINGYAYPFIDADVLDESLAYLSALSVFSYGFTTQGELIYPNVDDEWMINEALEAGVKPVLTLTPLDVNGRFSNILIHDVLINEDAVNALIDNLLTTVVEREFAGVDVDFEYILAEDRDRFTTFVARLTETLNQYGYEVSVALAPKTSSDQPGLLYEGKDYGGLGAAADHVLLMTYEWGYTYGPPMAVAPPDAVRRVIEYGLTEIPPEKILMGIPNYGYDWKLPFIKGESKAEKITNDEAVARAAGYGAEIMFDEQAMSPYYRYTDEDNAEHEVWFEDRRSMEAKFSLIDEYNLAGISWWNIMSRFPEGTEELRERFTVIKV